MLFRWCVVVRDTQLPTVELAFSKSIVMVLFIYLILHMFNQARLKILLFFYFPCATEKYHFTLRRGKG